MTSYGVKLRYLIGTMIELPRACLVADEIAEEAEFFLSVPMISRRLAWACRGMMPGNSYPPTYWTGYWLKIPLSVWIVTESAR